MGQLAAAERGKPAYRLPGRVQLLGRYLVTAPSGALHRFVRYRHSVCFLQATWTPRYGFRSDFRCLVLFCETFLSPPSPNPRWRLEVFESRDGQEQILSTPG